jgi:hypothetical protein
MNLRAGNGDLEFHLRRYMLACEKRVWVVLDAMISMTWPWSEKRVYTTTSIHPYLKPLPDEGLVLGLETKVQCPWKRVKATAKDCIAEEIHVSKKEWKKWLASME